MRSWHDWPGRALPGRRLCETTAVSGDRPQTTRVSDLFDPEPRTWGLRGDPHLWRALRARLASQDVPASVGELAGLLHAAFRELAGTDLAGGPASAADLEQYAHGGLSSGMISLDTWRQHLMPMLLERASARLPGWPRTRSRDTRPHDASSGTIRYASPHADAPEPPDLGVVEQEAHASRWLRITGFLYLGDSGGEAEARALHHLVIYGEDHSVNRGQLLEAYGVFGRGLALG